MATPAYMRVWTIEELYPPQAAADVISLLEGLPTGDHDTGGRAVLRRALSHAEKAILDGRQKVLAKWTERGSQMVLKAVVLQMVIGFGARGGTMAEADMTAAQYAYILRDLPVWAVKRAADRFSSGQVPAAEVGAKHIDVNYPPSSAQVHMVARALVLMVTREYAAITAILRGAPERPEETEEERAAGRDRVAAASEAFKVASAAANLVELQERGIRDAKRRSWLQAMNDENILRSYRIAGVEPPSPKPTHSLSLLLHYGWTVQDAPGGTRVLVRPPKAAPVKRETQPHEMGR